MLLQPGIGDAVQQCGPHAPQIGSLVDELDDLPGRPPVLRGRLNLPYHQEVGDTRELLSTAAGCMRIHTSNIS